MLITGADGYLGAYVSEAFLQVGARVVLLSNAERLKKQIADYRTTFGGDRVDGVVVDFYDREKLSDVLADMISQYDFDVLINNACDLSETTGFNTPQGTLESEDYDQWRLAFESGVYWAVVTSRILGEQFKHNGRGSIINVSSMYGIVSPNPKLYEGTELLNPPSYGVIKAGLVALTRYTASFWGKYGVRCNAILPGAFPNVEHTSANSVKSDDEFLDRLKARTVLNRVGHPNDLRGAMIFLASDASSYVTGQTIVIDGGWTIT